MEVIAVGDGRGHIHETWRFEGSVGDPVFAEAYLAHDPGPVVVIAHGRDNSRHATYVSGAGRLWGRRGISVIGCDAPLHGDRAGDPLPEAVTAAPDLLARWLADHRLLLDVVEDRVPDRPIGFVGISMGGVYGVHLMAADDRISAGVFVVLGSNRASFRRRFPHLDDDWIRRAAAVDAIGPAPRISPRPIMLLCAEDDELFPPASAVDLFAAFGRPKELVLMPGTHAEWASPVRWFRRMEGFLREELGGGGDRDEGRRRKGTGG